MALFVFGIQNKLRHTFLTFDRLSTTSIQRDRSSLSTLKSTSSPELHGLGNISAFSRTPSPIIYKLDTGFASCSLLVAFQGTLAPDVSYKAVGPIPDGSEATFGDLLDVICIL